MYRLLFLIIGLFPTLLPEALISYSVLNDSSHESTTCYLFAHGFGATQEQACRTHVKTKPELPWLIDRPLVLFNFPDAKNDCGGVLRKEVNLGQETDIQCLKDAYIKACTDFPENIGFVLTGISRGATTILNFFEKLSHKEQSRIKALVLESPFEALTSVMDHLLQRFYISWMPFAQDFAHAICTTAFPKINMNGPFAIHTVEKIPTNVPIILIHSKQDKVIPVNSSRMLYQKLKKAGNNNVYLVELASGDHGKVMNGPDASYCAYVVHAFYKKYNLPHKSDFAEKGLSLLDICQPNINQIHHYLKNA